MINALTIDLEDWRQLVSRRITGRLDPPDPAVLDEVLFILDTLAEHRVRATFFVLDSIAAAFPRMVRRISALGHEIASHGSSHQRIYNQTPDEFRRETREARQRLEEVTGEAVSGYRAAEFSITMRSLWALEILAEEGFIYDSSIYPIRGRRYGIPGFPPEPGVLKTRNGGRIVEFPPTTIEALGRRWPVAGGGYFALLPYNITREALRVRNGKGLPALVFLHPYEFSESLLRVRVPKPSIRGALISLRYSVLQRLTRGLIRDRFRRLLADFDFSPVRDLLNNV